MERFKGTPGPWIIEELGLPNPGNENCTSHIISTSEGRIIDVWMSNIHPCKTLTELTANAQLIATAPELLEVLQDLLKFCKSHNMDNFYTGSAEGVIDKALGI